MADIQSFNPSTEEEDIIFIPTEKEKNMGRSIDKQVMEQFDLPVDPLVQERIENIGKQLSSVADRKDLVYRFTVIKGKKPNNYNAFAVPGGYIYIFDDLVEKLETDDRVAGVLAHEMGHVEARHPMKRMQGAVGATALLVLTTISPADGQTKAKANAAIGQLMAAYSRHDERQSDALSVKYLKESGFDPNGAVEALEVLQGLMKRSPRMRYSFYKSHPYLSERIADLMGEVKGHADFEAYINVSSGTKDEL
jgi:predicted Zn-dependent protease